MNAPPKFDHSYLQPDKPDIYRGGMGKEGALGLVAHSLIDRHTKLHAATSAHSLLRDAARLTGTSRETMAHLARDEVRRAHQDISASTIQRAARRRVIGGDTVAHSRDRIPVIRIPGVDDIVLSRSMNPGMPPVNSAAARQQMGRLKQMLDTHGAEQLGTPSTHFYPPRIDRGRGN